jgi:hypothetical protein
MKKIQLDIVAIWLGAILLGALTWLFLIKTLLSLFR